VALDNLNILVGSTYEQGFILFNQFYKQTAYDGVLQTFSSPPAANPGENNYYYFPGQPRFYGATLKVRFE